MEWAILTSLLASKGPFVYTIQFIMLWTVQNQSGWNKKWLILVWRGRYLFFLMLLHIFCAKQNLRDASQEQSLSTITSRCLFIPGNSYKKNDKTNRTRTCQEENGDREIAAKKERQRRRRKSWVWKRERWEGGEKTENKRHITSKRDKIWKKCGI